MNNFYRKNWSKFCVVKIRYHSHSQSYDYVCLRSMKPEKGCYVCVSTGDDSPSHDNMQIAQITAVSTDVKHLSNQFELKPVVCIINTSKYNKVIKARGI